MFINKFIMKYAKAVKKNLIIAILFQVINTLLSSSVALFSSFLINEILKNRVFLTKKNIELVLLILVLIVLICIFNIIKTKITLSFGTMIKDNIRNEITNKLFKIGPVLFSEYRTGGLTSIMATRVEWLMSYYTSYFPTAIASIFNACSLSIFLCYLDIFTGITAIISWLAMLIIPMLFFKLMKKRGKEEWNQHSLYYSDCLDGLQGMTNLKNLNADKWYVSKIKNKGEIFRKSVMSHLKITMIEGALLEFFARIGSAFTIIVLAFRFYQGAFNSSNLVLLFFLIGAIFLPMLNLIGAWHLGFHGVSASYSINGFLNTDSDIIFKNKNLEKETIPSNCKKYKVDFSNVNFRYDLNDDSYILKNINIKINSNKMVALVGSSGSGKTTIAQLLAGFYKTESGKILINDIELNYGNKYKIQQLISAVWQDSHLFATSVYENILLAKPNASREEVYEVAKKAEIHDFILSLPEGYDTLVDEQGVSFSTGERQRIAIARAFLKKSPILIFDEATSALDRDNEIKIQKSFDALRKDKAVLVIAHRLQTILSADEICVLQNGVIVGRGAHYELVKKSLVYKKIMGEQLNG